MTSIPKPMLADNKSIHTDWSLLRLPVLGSPKIDGVRATVRDGVVYGRSGEPIKNVHVQAALKNLKWCDGELAIGPITAHDLCRKTCSVVNSKDKPIDGLTFNVFDHVELPGAIYSVRHAALEITLSRSKNKYAIIVPQTVLKTLEEVETYEDKILNLGFEGVMLRDLLAPYKHGRATLREGYLMKLKRFTDAEFQVVGFTERMHNGNEKQQDAFGRSKRSSHKENKTGRGDLGSLILKFGDTTFMCGAGFNDAEREEIWNNQKDYLNQLAKIKFFAKGMKDVPRHPTFLCWRDRNDL